MELLTDYLPLILPLVLIQITLVVAALLDLRKREELRGPKWLWIVIILFVNLIGPVLYFVAAREDE